MTETININEYKDFQQNTINEFKEKSIDDEIRENYKIAIENSDKNDKLDTNNYGRKEWDTKGLTEVKFN
jgi:hypothetical protein